MGTARSRRLGPEQMTEAQRELYERIVGGRRAAGPQPFALTGDDGALNGPFNALLLSPAMGGALQELGAAVRYRSELTDRARETAILLVAAHWGSAFEQAAHEAVGRTVGLTDDELAALRAAAPELPDPYEAAVVTVVLALLSRADLDDEEYADAVAALGDRAIFELTTLVGYYATLALQLRVFRVDE